MLIRKNKKIKKMEKLSNIINSFWFKSALCGAAGVLLLLYGHSMWAGVAFGWGANEFLEYFKPSGK